jgi:hypothetical protein
MRLSPSVLVQPDGWARGEREGYGEPCDVTSLSLSLKRVSPIQTVTHFAQVDFTPAAFSAAVRGTT